MCVGEAERQAAVQGPAAMREERKQQTKNKWKEAAINLQCGTTVRNLPIVIPAS